MAPPALNPNVYNPHTVWGCSYFGYVVLVVLYVPPGFLIALFGKTPLFVIAAAGLNFLVFVGLTGHDPFWTERFWAWLESLRSTSGSNFRVFDYNPG